MNKEVKQIVKYYEQFGLVFTYGSKHIKVTHENIAKPVFIPKTPSTRKSYKEIKHKLSKMLKCI